MNGPPMHSPQAKPWIMEIAPYVPGRATGDDGRRVVKLSSNENPLGTSAAAVAAFETSRGSLEAYPDAGATRLREAIAAAHGIDPARVIHGTGSDEVLHLVAGAFAGPGDEVVHVRYGFSVYEIATRRVGAVPIVAPDHGYATDVDAILACVTDRTRVVFVANPNNPTGTYTKAGEIARLHAALPPQVMLVIDQAYAEYIDTADDDGAFALAQTHANVFVTRTFSKIHGLAAERIGWGYGSAAAIDAMHRIRAPFNVTSAGQVAAIAALGDADFVRRSREHNRVWRAWFVEQIEALGNAGFRAVPSAANFVLVLIEPRGGRTAEAAYQRLLAAGYATRWLPNQGLPDALRITIGTEADMRAVVRELRAFAGSDAGAD